MNARDDIILREQCDPLCVQAQRLALFFKIMKVGGKINLPAVSVQIERQNSFSKDVLQIVNTPVVSSSTTDHASSATTQVPETITIVTPSPKEDASNSISSQQSFEVVRFSILPTFLVL